MLLWKTPKTDKSVFFNTVNTLNKHLAILGVSWSWKTHGIQKIIKDNLNVNKFIIVDHIWSYNPPISNFIEENKWKVISLDKNILINPLIFDKKLWIDLEEYINFIIFLFTDDKYEQQLDEKEKKELIEILYKLYNEPHRNKDEVVHLDINEIINEIKKIYINTPEKKSILQQLIIYLDTVKNGNMGQYFISNNKFNISKILKEEWNNNLILFDLKDIYYSTASYLIPLMYEYLLSQSIYNYISESVVERQKIVKELISEWAITEEWFKENIDSQLILPVYLVLDEIKGILRSDIVGEKMLKIMKRMHIIHAWLIYLTQEITDLLEKPYWKKLFLQTSSYLIYGNEHYFWNHPLIKETLLMKEPSIILNDENLESVRYSDHKPWFWLLIQDNWIQQQVQVF